VFGAAAEATVLSLKVPLGRAVESPLIRATTSAPTVTAEVTDATSQLLEVGQRVSVTGSAIGGAQNGTIDAIGGLVAEEDGVSRATVVIRPDTALPAAAVEGKVEITVLDGDDLESGLIVPLAAIRSNATGETYVTVVQGDVTSRVTVTVDETGGGEARVTAAEGALAAGDLVTLGVR
jgi:multidrug efflux pump subunit AcrA (membrane-fusion protein)